MRLNISLDYEKSLLSKLEIRSAHAENKCLGYELTSGIFLADVDSFVVLVGFLDLN